MRRTVLLFIPIISLPVCTDAYQRSLGCWNPRTQQWVSCTPTPSGPDAAAGKRQREEEERKRLAAEAQANREYTRGEEASAAKDFTRAIRYYRRALQLLPDGSSNEALYERRLRAVERERAEWIEMADSRALKESRGAASDQTRAAADRRPTRNIYDTGRNSDLAPVPVVSMPVSGLSVAIVRKLNIPVDLNDPHNADVKDALQRIEYTLEYNRQGAITGAWTPDDAALASRVSTLNTTLAKRGLPTSDVTPETVTAAYTSYRVTIRRRDK